MFSLSMRTPSSFSVELLPGWVACTQFLLRVIQSQPQDCAFASVDLHEVPVSPLLHPAEVVLNSSLALQHVDHSTRLSFAKLVRVASVPSSRSLKNVLNSTDARTDPTRDATNY